MFCRNCGAEIDGKAVVCPKCGVSVKSPSVSENDAPNMGFAVLSFIFPVVGLILFLCWQSTSPLKAKSCGKGALIGIIVEVVAAVLTVVVSTCVIASVMGTVVDTAFKWAN